MKRHYDHSNSYKESISFQQLSYSFRSSVFYHHDGEHDSKQAVMVLERKLRVLHLAGNGKLTETLGSILSKVINHSSKTTPPNGTTHCENMGQIIFTPSHSSLPLLWIIHPSYFVLYKLLIQFWTRDQEPGNTEARSWPLITLKLQEIVKCSSILRPKGRIQIPMQGRKSL